MRLAPERCSRAMLLERWRAWLPLYTMAREKRERAKAKGTQVLRNHTLLGSRSMLRMALSANQGGEKWSRYSMIGLPARRVYKIRGQTLSIEEAGETIESRELIDPFQFVSDTQAKYSYPIIEGYPQFTGGLVGYFGYDTVRYVEPRLANSTPPEASGRSQNAS